MQGEVIGGTGTSSQALSPCMPKLGVQEAVSASLNGLGLLCASRLPDV